MKKIIMAAATLATICFAEVEIDPLKFGMDRNSCDEVLYKKGYVNCYNNTERGSNFTLVHARDIYMPEEVLEKEFDLADDLELDKKFRSTAEDYVGLRDLLPTKLKQTFLTSGTLDEKKEGSLFSNTVPMSDAAYKEWEKVEDFEKNIIKKYKSIYIITGVVYPERDERMGDKMGIPNLFYKIYFSADTNKMMGIAIPQKGKSQGKGFYNYTLPVKDLEQMTGIKFFPKLKEETAISLKSKTSHF